VAVERWSTLPASELKELLRAARGIVYEKLPKKTKEKLAGTAGKRAAGKKKVAAGRG
jgi:predicted DNA-binding protein (MmcQ/YjbR family)